MSKEKIEMSVELNGQEVVAYPYVNSDHVLLDNNMTIDKMLESDVVEPVITHEEVSFKVGQGDSDLSDSIVDSSAGGFTVKGQTYQNILPEPSTHVLSNNKEMFKVNEGLDSNVEIVDGVSKSAILSGNTLVNLCDDGVADASDIERFTHNYTSNGGTFEQVSDGIKATTTQDNTWLIVGYDIRSQQKKTMTIGKKYYGVADVTIHKLSNSDSCKVIFRAQYGLRESKSLTNGRGLVQNVFTHSSVDANYGWLSVGTNTQKAVVGDSFTIHSMSVYEITEEEVNLSYEELANKYPVKCVGMQSVKVPVLKTTGKNLCKYRSDWTHGGLTFTNTNSGVTVNGTASTIVDYYVTARNGSINVETLHVLNSLQVGTRIFLSNNLGKNNYIAYTLNGEINYADNVTIQNGMEITGAFVRFQQGDICNNLNLTIQLEVGNEATPYEPYKSNILTVNEDITLRGVGDVKDTLDCLTGEYVQRIGEVVLDGSEDENWVSLGLSGTGNSIGFYIPINNKKSVVVKCDKLPLTNYDDIAGIKQGGSESVLQIRMTTEYLASLDLNSFKIWLAQNPLTVQYKLATESIKTLDLSSSGNWEKVVLDGSENWSVAPDTSNNNAFFRGGNTVPNNVKVNSNNLAQKVICDILTPFTQDQICNKPNDNYGISLGWNDSNLCVRHKDFPLTNEGLTQWKQYLSQNPLTVWYQTATHQDSTQVKQPIFFKDGHIQLSSGADNSLIPTLDYQAKTSNSYVMDLMKTNTKYTMKAKSASGTFTIDGTSYGAGTNGTFTTPSSMTNKLLVMSNKTNEEVMIIEGDVVSKTIPYFKGIKSAFEGEDKIEVLSTGKNLFDITKIESIIQNNRFKQEVVENTIKIENLGVNGAYYSDNINFPILLTEGKTYTLTYDYEKTGNANAKVRFFTMVNGGTKTYVGDDGFTGNFTFKAKSTDVVYMSFYSSTSATSTVGDYVVYKNIQLEESLAKTSYQPYKLNSTKIPLLSPLRSLPNGVCDELIVDRANNKAKIIQRVSEELMKLETPVITEVDLEGFPYVYKDGHIFLNSEIAPTTTIKYSINQAQVIQSQNSDIIRHSKEITNLHRLISEYVQVQYESTLLNLKVKMRA